MSVDDLVRQANAAAAREDEELAAAYARRRPPAEPPMPVKPAWLQAAEELCQRPVTPEEAERRERAAEAAEREAKRVALARDASRVEEACRALPALYSDALGSRELLDRVGRKAAVADTVQALAFPGIVWTGSSGAGKTSLACAAAREWARFQRGGRILFSRASELATASRYHALGEGRPKMVDQAIKADLLILDELGEPMRAAQWDDVGEVVFARYEQNRPTWVTTWLAPDQVKSLYGDGFARRLFERSAVIACDAEQ